ncbi:MAG: AAC(3) family N-acetyltransferase [Verrucomicrobia bacterium]|nr:AAC(3) family N-acetyltransferase [Verrucomicrobiota bacterium]
MKASGIGPSRIVRDLRALGVRAGDAVMMHSSLSALGHVEGGATTVVDALLEAVGPRGTLLVPAFRDSVWGDPANFTNSDCAARCPQRLCPSKLPGFQGVIAEEVRQRTGSLRSCHPTHSWVALGASAERLVEGHRASPTPCGRGNPFEALLQLDGCILTLGVQVNTVTLWHYYEEILQVPYLGHYWPKERHLNHCVTGRRIQYEYPGVMQDVCRAAGILKTGPIGKSVSGLMRARDFDCFMATLFADDPYCLVLRPPDRGSDDLALDALQKAAAMLRARKRGRQGGAKSFAIPPQPIAPAKAGDVVREDCPAFAGCHEAFGNSIPLCKANGSHPELFRLGGVFAAHGPAACAHCSWHLQFPPKREGGRPVKGTTPS